MPVGNGSDDAASPTSGSGPSEKGGEIPDADIDLPEVPEAEPSQRARSGRFRRVAGAVVPLLAGAAAVGAVVAVAGDSSRMVESLREVRPAGAGLALAAEVASYLFLGLHLRALGGPADNIRRLAPFRIATVVFGLGSVLPAAPAEGIVMAASALKHRRLSRRRTVLVLGVSQFFGTIGLYLLAAIDAIAVVLSAHDGPLAARSFLVAGGFGTLVVLAGVALVTSQPRVAEIGGLIAGRIRHPREPAPPRERRQRGLAWHAAGMHVITDQRKAPWLVATMLLGWALDGICLYFALVAVGVRIDLDVLLLAYSASAAASLIPFLPAGLGVAETITPAILHLYGVPFETGLAGLLVYRAVGTLLPAVVGAGCLASLRLLHAPEATRDEAAAIADTARR